MSITASQVKELRERTGAGMMDCKKALGETAGDLDAAIALLRKKGAASAEKKAGRIAAEGVIQIAIDSQATRGVLVEVNCETDFVAKDNTFIEFSAKLANIILEQVPADTQSLSSLNMSDGETVEMARQNLISRIGENISIRRFTIVNGDPDEISSYLHGTRIGTIVRVAPGKSNVAKDIAMHVAASRPLCIDESDMPNEVIEKEKEIFLAQASESGKEDAIVKKMVEGKLKKFLKESTLNGQAFVKNPDKSVKDVLDESSAEVIQMERYEVGEGLEKRSDDFVAEVMSQAQAG